MPLTYELTVHCDHSARNLLFPSYSIYHAHSHQTQQTSVYELTGDPVVWYKKPCCISGALDWSATVITLSNQSSPWRSILISSTSKTSVAPPGILGGEPLSPYPRSDGITSFLFSPSHILQRNRKAVALKTPVVIQQRTSINEGPLGTTILVPCR